MKPNLPIYLFTLFYLLIFVKGINILSKNVYNKNINSMGVDINYALYDISFDQDLYIYKSFGCPIVNEFGSLIKFNSSISSCICDYKLSNSPVNPCSTSVCVPPKSNVILSKEWVSLEIDKSSREFTISNQQQFRFTNDRDSLGFSIEIIPINGSFKASLNGGGNLDFDSTKDDILFSVCPGDYMFNVIRGTYFFDVYPLTSNVTFSIRLVYISIPEAIVGSSYTTGCTSTLSETHECFDLGSIVNYVTEPTNYQLPIPDSSFYTIQFSSQYDMVLLISDDSNNVIPKEDNAKYIIKNSGNTNNINSLTIYIDKSTSPLIYFRLQCSTISGFCTSFDSTQPTISVFKSESQNLIKKKISSMNLLEGSLALPSTSRISLGSQDSYLSCSEYFTCNPFSILLPVQQVNPLWPVPSILYNIPDFNFRYMEVNSDSSPIKEKSYQFALVLSVNFGKGQIEYLSYQNASNVELEFLSIFNLDNQKINLKITDFKDQPINQCNYQEYKNTINQINDNNNNNNSIEKLNNWKYQLSLLQSTNNWISCENLALDYLNLGTVLQNLTTYQCPYSISDPRYELDPCCNYHLAFSKACKEKTSEFQVFKVLNFNDEKIVDQCFSKDCTTIVLDQYASKKLNVQENNDCKVSSFDAINYHLESYNALRMCRKSQLTIPSCYQDQDCSDFSQGTRGCDIFTRKCIANFEIIDKRYIGCVLENLPSGSRYSYISTLQVNDSIVDTIYDRLSSQGYVVEGSDSKHSVYNYFLNDNGDGDEDKQLDSLTTDLIDYSNEIDYKSKNQLLGWVFEKDDFAIRLENTEAINCEVYYKMLPKNLNPNVYDNYTYYLGCDTDHPEIKTEHSFCGYCKYDEPSNTYCHIYNQSLSHTGSSFIRYSDNYPFSSGDVLVDATECNQGLSMCLLKDGAYLENIVKEDCEDNKGTCSVPCGYECTGISSACLWIPVGRWLDSVSQSDCEDLGFSYQDQECMTFSLTEEQCNSMGSNFTWLDCISKDSDNCMGPTWDIQEYDEPDRYDAYRKMCTLKEIPCVSKEQCLRQGKCSDYNIFYEQIQVDDHYIAYPNGLGKCILPHSYDTIYGKNCDTAWQVDSPKGCYTLLSVPSKELCQSRNGTWWTASKTKEECESQMACKTLDFIYTNTVQNINPYNLPYATRYNEMNQEDCLIQQKTQPGTKWTNIFTWSEAIWYPGISVKSKWYQDKRFESIYQLRDKVFDYQEFYNEIEEATKKQISVLYSSQSLCQKEKTESYLSSILCSCMDDSSQHKDYCFNSTNRILAQSISCNGDGESKPLVFSNGKVLLGNTSISFGCEMISVSQISRSTYSISSPQPLSNNFISYEKPDDYAVLNEKNAIIGTVISDGIILKSEYGFNEIKLCMTFSSSSSSNDNVSGIIGGNPNQKKYPILDFAILNKLNNKLEPLDTVAEISNSNNNNNSNNSNSNSNYYCSIISNLSTNEIIYPINRISNWKDQDKKVLDNKTTVLVYMLACLFTLVGTYGLIQTIEILIARFKSSQSFQLTHLLIVSVTSFLLIRGVYFFILPSGSLTDIPGSDFVFVVLPTFIYLSSFSLVIALWYIIVFVVLKFNPKAGDMRKRLFTIVTLINTIIYIFFVAIVVIFQYTPFEPNTDCVGLIKEEMKNSNQQIAVSIAYSVVQAFISLFIGLAFIFLGTSIIKAMKQSNLGGVYSNNQPKIKALTIVCSISFIAHTIFIILISVKAVKSIIFTFVGLIITELLPATLLLYYFDSRFINSTSTSSKPSTNSSSTDKSKVSKSIQLNTVTTESSTESSEYIIKK